CPGERKAATDLVFQARVDQLLQAFAAAEQLAKVTQEVGIAAGAGLHQTGDLAPRPEVKVDGRAPLRADLLDRVNAVIEEALQQVRFAARVPVVVAAPRLRDDADDFLGLKRSFGEACAPPRVPAGDPLLANVRIRAPGISLADEERGDWPVAARHVGG